MRWVFFVGSFGCGVLGALTADGLGLALLTGFAYWCILAALLGAIEGRRA